MIVRKYWITVFCLVASVLLAGCVPQLPKIEIPRIDVPNISSPTSPFTQTVKPSNQTPTQPYTYTLPAEYAGLFAQSDWIQTPTLPVGFFTGNAFMDWYSDITYRDYLDSTLDSMQQSGGQWVVFDNYWSYYSIEPPVMRPFTDRSYGVFRDATEEEIAVMIQKTHARNMKFVLVAELNWDVMRGEWQGWEYQQKFWEKSAKILEEKARELDNPTPETNIFWDNWFENYSKFVLNQAAVAQKYNADMLVIGKQIDGAVTPGNEQRWKALIAKVRAVYRGLLSYGAWTNQDYTQAAFMPYEDLDYIIIYYYNEISTLEQPSISELKTSFENFNRNQFQPLSEKYGKQIIFLTPFQSRDFGAKQEWFEPSAPSPDVKEDLLIQAKLYEAFFQSVQDEAWVAGVWTWGYWWRDDFNTMYRSGDCSFNKSSTIRNKPAATIFNKWSP